MIPRDLHGKRIKRGDPVEFILCGATFQAAVDKLVTANGMHYVEAQITVHIRATSVVLLEEDHPNTSKQPQEEHA